MLSWLPVGDGHAEGAVGKDFYLDEFALGAANVVAFDEIGDFRHLFQRQFAGCDHHVGETRVVTHRLGVGDVALCGDMHLELDGVGVLYHRHVGGDDCAHAALLGEVEELAHLVDFVVVDDGVHREVGAYAVLTADVGNLAEVVVGEVVGRARTHVEVAHAEINGIGTALYGGHQRLVRAHGRHYLYFFHRV